jgi:serine/threonine protein kinase
MYYLESRNLVHRDISYTNILLRHTGKDSIEKQAKRREIMDELGLSEIESLRNSLNCREGLLIDFDYASSLELNAETGQTGASASSLDPNAETDQTGASNVNESQDESQGESREDFELIDDEDSKTVIQPIAKRLSGTRTVSYF